MSAKKTMNATGAAAKLRISRQWFYKLAEKYGIVPDPAVDGRQWKLSDINRIERLEKKAGRLGGN